MKNKTILITGAAGGIGRATVALFAEKDWRVIGVDRNTLSEVEGGNGFPKNGLFNPILHAPKICTPSSRRLMLLLIHLMH